MNPLTHCKKAIILPFLVALVLTCFALSPQMRAVGQEACLTNNNTVQGDDALISLSTNTFGSGNTATGAAALFSNTTGSRNTASGSVALNNNTAGVQNTATGTSALLSNSTANNDTADGYAALLNNTGGTNTAIGSMALLHSSTGSSNIGLGASCGVNLTIGSNNIDIGNFGGVAESNTIRIGQVQTRTRRSERDVAKRVSQEYRKNEA